ncbi:MAG: hypothetical protein V3R87_07710 [Dehalococcoidia bacterium]
MSAIIVTKMACNPFAPSQSRGRSWFDKLTTNGIKDVNRGKNSHFHPSWCRRQAAWQITPRIDH